MLDNGFGEILPLGNGETSDLLDDFLEIEAGGTTLQVSAQDKIDIPAPGITENCYNIKCRLPATGPKKTVAIIKFIVKYCSDSQNCQKIKTYLLIYNFKTEF